MAHEGAEGQRLEEGNCDILSKTPRWGNGQILLMCERRKICGVGGSIAFLRRNAGDCVVQGAAIGRGRGESLNIETREAVSPRLLGELKTIGQNVLGRKCWIEGISPSVDDCTVGFMRKGRDDRSPPLKLAIFTNL